MGELPHLDESGHARMVDVGAKPATEREAEAEAVVHLHPDTVEVLFRGKLPKGDALAVARIAGIQAAKKTAELVPLCHPIPVTAVDVAVEESPDGARIVTHVSTTAATGVEMEALTAASVAALALYDMIKSQDRGAEIGPVRLLRKSGGRSGEWVR